MISRGPQGQPRHKMSSSTLDKLAFNQTKGLPSMFSPPYTDDYTIDDIVEAGWYSPVAYAFRGDINKFFYHISQGMKQDMASILMHGYASTDFDRLIEEYPAEFMNMFGVITNEKLFDTKIYELLNDWLETYYMSFQPEEEDNDFDDEEEEEVDEERFVQIESNGFITLINGTVLRKNSKEGQEAMAYWIKHRSW